MSREIPTHLKNILEICRYAPSSHNTQPWLVKLGKDNVVTVGYRPEKQLKIGDPTKRELFISLGCFIESFVLAAKKLGYKTSVKFSGTAPDKVMELTLKSGTPATIDWTKLIKNRRSDRRFYDNRPLPSGVMRDLESLKEKNVSPILLTNPEDLDFVAAQTYEATYRTMSNPEFRDELASWVRNNWTKKPDGMPAYTQGIPGPVSLIAKLVIRKNKKIAKDQAKKDSARIRHSSVVVLLSANHEEPQSWLEAGRLYQRLCVVALQRGLKTSGVSAAIIDPLTTKQIIKRFKLPGSPVALIRVGYTKNTPKASPRLSLSELIVSD